MQKPRNGVAVYRETCKYLLVLCSCLFVFGDITGAFSAEVNPLDESDYFEKHVRPILIARCESCHSNARGKTQGGLALDTKAGWEKGGGMGVAIEPNKPEASLLIQAVQYMNDDLQMPPKEAGGKIPDAEIAVLVEWVKRGAYDPRTNAPTRGGLTEEQLRQWWSFQPLRVVDPPVSAKTESVGDPKSDGSGENVVAGQNEGGKSSHPVDAFLDAKLDAAKLKAVSVASKRDLIRRVTYDLTGLPPTVEEVSRFEADQSPDAYERLIERLLTSRQYGERWGRHWLDLVRYADTAGENSDHPVPDAWRYRNWVIDAFNRDLPYDQFLQEQIAGDLIHASDAGEAYSNGIVGTGYLAIARRFEHDSDKNMHLTIEDTIDTFGKSILGLSIACARCHDHKYDPMSSNDYYALYGIFNSTRFAFPGCEAKQQPRDLVPLVTPAEWAKTVEPFDRSVAEIDANIAAIDQARAQQGKDLKVAVERIGSVVASGKIPDSGAIEFESVGELGQELQVQVGELIQLVIGPDGNYGADTTIIEVTIQEQDGEQRKWELTKEIADGFLDENSHADRFSNPNVWWYLDPRNGLGLLAEPVSNLSGHNGLSAWRNGDNPAVFVNTTTNAIGAWTSLPPRTVFVHPAPDGPVAIGWLSPIAGKIRIGGTVRDGHPGGPNGVEWSIVKSNSDNSAGLLAMVGNARARTVESKKRNELMAQAPPREFAYAVTEGAVANARMHLRGDPEKLGDEVPRRWLEILGGQRISSEAASGRLDLARWITSRENPLTARVMVNRIWQLHFGKGIVQTPNDFGTRGVKPTHPELLDWLARQFIESGWSIKSMHRLIMNSEAYRRATSTADSSQLENSMAVDPNNTLLWRFDRRRLSAEELRDSLLIVSGQLDHEPGKAHPIPPTNTWNYSQHVPFAGVPENNKRSVYMMTVRNRRNRFMALFDGADPNATTPQRQVTTVPTQSLYFLNDPFFHEQAHKLTARVLVYGDASGRIRELYRVVLQREPTDIEVQTAVAFLDRYSSIASDSGTSAELEAYAAFSRILLASNEFLYLD